MPRIVQPPRANAATARGKKPDTKGTKPASAGMASLLARGLVATEDHSPQDRQAQRETLQEMTAALEEAGFTLSTSKHGQTTFAHDDGTHIAVSTTLTSLKVAYSDGKKKALDAKDIALAIPLGTAPDKTVAAKFLALAQGAGKGAAPDAMDLKKAGFPQDPSTSSLLHPDGSWAVDVGDGFVVGHGDKRIWPTTASDTAAAAEAQPSAPAQPVDVVEKPKSERAEKKPKADKPEKLPGTRAPAALTPSTWNNAVPAHPSDATLDATLFLAEQRNTRSLRAKLDGAAREVPMKPADGWKQECWRFPDGSQLVLAIADGETQLRAFLVRADATSGGAPINVDLDKAGLFQLPLTTETGPAAATLDRALLTSPDAAAQLEKLGFKNAGGSGRLFVHQDGSWAVIADKRVAAGVGDRRYALGDAAVERENALGALPAWLRSMVHLSAPGQDVDLQLMAKQLSALDDKMLRALHDAGYSLNVTRYRLSNADKALKDETITGGGAGPAMFDLAEGVHSSGGGKKPHITIRTYLVEGTLRIDVSTLLHEIGHAFDLVVGAPAQQQPNNPISSRMRGAGGGGGAAGGARDPLNVEQELVDAFTAEHPRLPQYFHTQVEFFAETFALYMLDATRCKRQFPKAFAFFDKRFANIKPDAAALLALEQGFEKPAVVVVAEGSPDLRKKLAFSAQQNRVLRENGMPAQPIVAHIEGKADWGFDAYAAGIAQEVRASFGKEAGVYRSNENLITLTAAQLNSADEIDKILTDIETSGRPAVLYVKDASQLQKNGPLFQVYEQFLSRHRDVPPLVIAGEATALAAVDGGIQGAVRLTSKIEALDPEQQAELASRMAAQEGFFFADGVVEALTKKLKGGGYEGAASAWRSVKTAQFERHLKSADKSDAAGDGDGGAMALSAVREITKADVAAMKVSSKKTPAERLAEMIGQEAAKRAIDSITKQAKVSAMRRLQGLPDPDPPRMNLMFSGAPGTGKTTFAEILGGLLQEIGYIKNPSVTKVTIQDLISGSPEQAVKQLFAQNKGGVIFIDEMHQLKDTQEGRRAFRAMIPYLADPAYADTVFIGAGYSDELGQLIRDIDPGAERRFTTVPFLDYKREELATILDVKLKGQNLVMGPEAREAALAFLDYRKRITKNFGNAGEVDIALAHAQKAQTLRIAEMPTDKITRKVLMELVADDFKVPAPLTKEEFWREMDKMSGWDEVKAQLKQMAASIEGAVRRGKAPTDAVEPYWIIDGPPGTGKSTLARMLSMFGAAYGLTALPEVIDLQGANFQGEFVGQTAGVVQKQFEKAWGRLMFVDEVSGLAKSGGEFKFEAAKMILAQTENHRGKFMMVVADYAENINQFLGLDPGLARRFGNRITLKPWTPEQATDDLMKKLAAEGIVVVGLDKVMGKLFVELAKLPGYASGGDVRTLKNAIVALLDAMPNIDPDELLPKAMQQAFDALVDKKKKDAGPAAQNPESSARAATATATAADVKEKEEHVELDAEDQKVLAAFDATNVKLAAQMNNLSMEEIERLESDPNSFFAKELAKKLGVKPAEAVKSLVKVKVKVKKLVQIKKQELQQRFQYWCPYCGGIDSPSCGYINYPLDWKIQHSRKKPWTEVKETTITKEVEVIEDREVKPGD